MLTPWKKSYDQPRQHIKKQRHYFANKGLSSQGYGFSSSHVWMWELDYKESWVQKNWCFWIVVLEKTLESPLDCKEIKPIHRKGNQSWIFIGRTDAEAETPILWLPDPKNWLIWKDPDAGKDWRQEEKGMTEDEMVGWHHWLYGQKFKQALGVGDGQGSLSCCSPWGCKDWGTELNWDLKVKRHSGRSVDCRGPRICLLVTINHILQRPKQQRNSKVQQLQRLGSKSFVPPCSQGQLWSLTEQEIPSVLSSGQAFKKSDSSCLLRPSAGPSRAIKKKKNTFTSSSSWDQHSSPSSTNYCTHFWEEETEVPRRFLWIKWLA